MNVVEHARFADGYRPMARPRTPESRLGLGSATVTDAESADAAINPPWYSYLVPWGPAVYYADALSNLTIPGSSPTSLGVNAATGQLTQDQVQQIKQQAASEIVAAGGSESDVQQAIADINASVAGNVASPAGAAGAGLSTFFSLLPAWAWIAVGFAGFLLIEDMR